MTEPLLFDIIGLMGSALMIGGFAYANLAKDLNKVVFNLLNLAGAALLLVSLSVKFNLGAFVLEAVWAVIAIVGLVSALRKSPSRVREGLGVGPPDPGATHPSPAPPARGRGEA